MLERCYTPTSTSYPNYGGRGIGVSPQWRVSFEQFLRDVGSRPGPEYSIERLDNNRGYEQGNVVWADTMTQANNTRANHRVEYEGRTQTLAQWAREAGLPYTTLRKRISLGWSMREILTIPLGATRRSLTWQGRTQTFKQWEAETGIDEATLYSRIMAGWPPEKALTQPARPKKA